MNFTHVKSLLAVIDTGSFAAAAKELRISQPAVSQHVRKLEESFGVRLVERGGSRCAPTPRAIEFIRHSRTLLEVAERARRSLVKEELVVGASSNVGTYLIQPLFTRFLEDTGVTGRLLIDSNPVVARMLQEGEIDVAAMEWRLESKESEERFQDRLWMRDPLVLVVGRDHPWYRRTWVRPEALVEERILGGESGTGTGRVLQSALGPLAHQLQVVQKLGSTEAVKEGVKAGLGVSIVLRSAVIEELSTGSLHEVALRGVTIEKEIRLITPTAQPSSSVATRFCRSICGDTEPPEYDETSPQLQPRTVVPSHR